MNDQISMFNESVQNTKLDDCGCFIKYHPNYYSHKDANNLLHSLLNEIKWDDNKKPINNMDEK